MKRSDYRLKNSADAYPTRVCKRRLDSPEATRLITWNVERGQGPLRTQERNVIVTALRFFDRRRYKLRGFVVMDDHVHVLIDTFNSFPVFQVIHSWKSFTAHEFIRRCWRWEKTWKRGSHENVIASKCRLYRALRYIELNPVRRWPGVLAYPWVWIE